MEKKNHLIPLSKANVKSNTIKCTHKAFIAGLDKGGSADRSRRFRWIKIEKKPTKITCTVNVVPGYHKKRVKWGKVCKYYYKSVVMAATHTKAPPREQLYAFAKCFANKERGDFG